MKNIILDKIWLILLEFRVLGNCIHASFRCWADRLSLSLTASFPRGVSFSSRLVPRRPWTADFSIRGEREAWGQDHRGQGARVGKRSIQGQGKVFRESRTMRLILFCNCRFLCGGNHNMLWGKVMRKGKTPSELVWRSTLCYYKL